jgi:hypothetical protein
VALPHGRGADIERVVGGFSVLRHALDVEIEGVANGCDVHANLTAVLLAAGTASQLWLSEACCVSAGLQGLCTTPANLLAAGVLEEGATIQ